MNRKERNTRLMTNFKEIFSKHELRDSGPGWWLLQSRYEDDGSWKSDFAAKVVTGLHNEDPHQLTVFGDFHPVTFGFYGGDARGILPWIGRCPDLSYYVAQKASIASGDAVAYEWDNTIAVNELAEHAANTCGCEHNAGDLEAIRRAMRPASKSRQDLESYLVTNAPHLVEDLCGVGTVTASAVYIAHAAVARLCDLVDEEYLVKFNQPEGPFGDVIKPGAFARSLEERKTRDEKEASISEDGAPAKAASEGDDGDVSTWCPTCEGRGTSLECLGHGDVQDVVCPGCSGSGRHDVPQAVIDQWAKAGLDQGQYAIFAGFEKDVAASKISGLWDAINIYEQINLFDFVCGLGFEVSQLKARVVDIEGKLINEKALRIVESIRDIDKIRELEARVEDLEAEEIGANQTTCGVYDQIVAITGIQDGWDYPGQVVRCVEDAIKAARAAGRAQFIDSTWEHPEFWLASFDDDFDVSEEGTTREEAIDLALGGASSYDKTLYVARASWTDPAKLMPTAHAVLAVMEERQAEFAEPVSLYINEEQRVELTQMLASWARRSVGKRIWESGDGEEIALKWCDECEEICSGPYAACECVPL